MTNSRVSHIKRSQKESQILREISDLFVKIVLDNNRLQGLIITRVLLSRDKGVATILFFTDEGEEKFKEQLELLKLYKPSLRASLAKKIASRYVPELIFKFDEQFEKERKIHNLLDKLKEGGEI